MKELVTLIGSLGFPIVMCLLCFWFCYKVLMELAAQIKANTEAINSLKKSLENRGGKNEIS